MANWQEIRIGRRDFLKIAGATAGLSALNIFLNGCMDDNSQKTPEDMVEEERKKFKERVAKETPADPEQMRIKALQEQRHREFHYPKIEGKEVPATPYLTLPFRSRDIPEFGYEITEGWEYSKEESAIHGLKNHRGVDIAVPYGTLVVAPADGYAMSSYHTRWIKDEAGKEKTYEGKSIRFGLGYFIQMYIPGVNRFVQLAHLSELDPAIPFSKPVYNRPTDNWNPVNHTLRIHELKDHPAVVFVGRGTPLGKVGFSGLAWGYKDYNPQTERPVAPDPEKFKSWDEPHVHLEDFWRDQGTGEKGWQRDPYAIYLTAGYYPDPKKDQPDPRNNLRFGKDPLWFFAGDMPAFAA